MRFEPRFFRSLEERLAKDAPGPAAQMAMAPKPRIGDHPFGEAEKTSSKAGVMLLLYPKEGSTCLVLIRRTQTVMHHRDQIGLPGGQVEGTETFEQAALRETWEELGVRPELIRILGRLTPLYIPVSDFCVYPVVGVVDQPLTFVPDPHEAAEVIELPLDHLANTANVRLEDWVIRDIPVEVPFYGFGPHKIWGATAMVLAEFIEVLKDLAAT
jgi:8-oxo-dGTP pyrophosphatase MutT (NUDIX family)